MKRRWKQTAGFTLVELIVVIAILGILAGVAVPVYSGYVKKANLAADQTLVDSINTAFAAACLENQVNIGDETIAQPDIPVNDDGTLDLTNASLVNDDVLNSFVTYFGANANNAFKVAENIFFNPDTDMFEIPDENAGGLFAQIFGAHDFGALVEKINGSVFGDIGAAGLMNKVDTATSLSTVFAFGSDNYAEFLANLGPGMMEDMGLTGEDEFLAMAQAKAAEMREQYPDADEDELITMAMHEMMSNYAVLQAAKSTVARGNDTAALLADIRAQDYSSISTQMKGNHPEESIEDGLSRAAMMYALYTAYANGLPEDSAERETALNNVEVIGDFTAAMDEDQAFRAYLNGEGDSTVEKDLEGYLAALEIIDTSAKDNSEAVTTLVNNGYTDPALLAALNGLLG